MHRFASFLSKLIVINLTVVLSMLKANSFVGLVYEGVHVVGPLYVLERRFPVLIKTWHFPLFMHLLRLNALVEKCTPVWLTNALIWIQWNWFKTLLLNGPSFISSLYCLMSL